MIALVAHDEKKASRVKFVERHVAFFRKHELVATDSTGALLRVCDVHNIPLATNAATAEAVLGWLKMVN